MRPQFAALAGVESVELVFHRDRKDAAIGDGGRTVHRRADVGAPDHLAVGGIERQHLGIAGGNIEAGFPERWAAPAGIFAPPLPPPIRPPPPAAAWGVERAYLPPPPPPAHPPPLDD